MGIGGQGISAVAQMVLKANGESVAISGCDMQASATTRALERVGVPVQIGHSPAHLQGIDRLVVVPAALVLNPDHPELATARERNIPLNTWQEMLGELMTGKCVFSVSGVHGKGTTTAMLALILVDAGFDPTCEVGAVVPRFGVNYRLGQSSYFVNEADEFYNNFWHYHPRLAIITAIEFEHPEFFANYAEFLASFEHFVRGMDLSEQWALPPTLILNADSPGCLELWQRLSDWPGQVITYSVEGYTLSQKSIDAASIEKTETTFNEETALPTFNDTDVTNGSAMPSNSFTGSTFAAVDVQLAGETSFRVRSQWEGSFPSERRITLQLPGLHNVQNALAAIAAATVAGVDAETIIQTIENFGGIRRRFEIRNSQPIAVNGTLLDVILVDDYAHHPTAIAASLEAARRRYPERRLVAVYQPHMYSRTKTFFEQFLHAFDLADLVIISEIFPARERDTGSVSTPELVEAMAKQPHFSSGSAQVIAGGSVQATTELLRDTLRSGDLALIMGAGDIYTVTESLLA